VKVILWLSIRTPPVHLFGGPQQLWRREITTGCVPVPGQDTVGLWVGDEEEPGPAVRVQSRQMDADGGWSLELATLVVDPDDQTVDQIKQGIVAGHAHHHEVVWSYGKDDYLDQLRVNLVCAGWVEQ